MQFIDFLNEAKDGIARISEIEEDMQMVEIEFGRKTISVQYVEDKDGDYIDVDDDHDRSTACKPTEKDLADTLKSFLKMGKNDSKEIASAFIKIAKEDFKINIK